MNRIERRLAALAAAGRRALLPFVTAGDPDPERSVELLHALVAAGADLIELGVPFSDPMADGPVIQRASERALARGVTLPRVLEWVREFRAADRETPIVLMGYLNPVEQMGPARFAREAAAAGADGVLLVDCPLEESEPYRAALEAEGLIQVLMAAPTTSGERLRRIARAARGFLYFVAYAGVTGADRLRVAELAPSLAAIRRESGIPVAVGFGIKAPDDAAAVAALADAVVVGSALVDRLHRAGGDPAAEAARFLAPLRAAIDRAAAGPRELPA
ncbi:MAG: tryptophan synthase subunit alpha [Xanthomonadales bacterium]|nr:tryptophan synthase subunit alpha [Xanthomonadales bacterium]